MENLHFLFLPLFIPQNDETKCFVTTHFLRVFWAIYRIKSHDVSNLILSWRKDPTFLTKSTSFFLEMGVETNVRHKFWGESRQQLIFIYFFSLELLNIHKFPPTRLLQKFGKAKRFSIRPEGTSSLSINNETLWYYSDNECMLIPWN